MDKQKVLYRRLGIVILFTVDGLSSYSSFCGVVNALVTVLTKYFVRKKGGVLLF